MEEHAKYYPPGLKKTAYHCPRCQVFAKQVWFPVKIEENFQTRHDTDFNAAYCTHCREWNFWHLASLIVPADAPVPPPHVDLPEICKDDYVEAREVFSKSPKSAAALLRLCIQKLLGELGESGKNINNDIKNLVLKGLPPLVQKALDYCRVVGNNAVHPGEIILDDTPEMAQSLFEMINFIVEDRITQPKDIETLYSKIPESARQAIDQRDGRGGEQGGGLNDPSASAPGL